MLHLSVGLLSFSPQFAPATRAARSSRVQMTTADEFTLAILGDLHLDPRDLDHSFEGRDHFKKIFSETDSSKFVVSLGDLGESKDCTGSGSLFAGTTECFKLSRDFLDGFGEGFDVVGGNHDLEGIDEFPTDEENLEAYLSILGKKTPQFCHEIAEKTLVVGLGSTAFRSAKYTSHEVVVDDEQIAWFEDVIAKHPAEEGWKVFCFSHAPIIGSGLRVLQECHVVNGCCWLNHNDGVQSKKFIDIVRKNTCIKGWFSGHFHLSHDYEDSMSFPAGNNRGSCIFAQTAVMTARSTRDGRRQSRMLRGNKDGFEVCTVNHAKGGEVRVDATVTYTEEGSTAVMAHKHEDLEHGDWFRAYTPMEEDGCYIVNNGGVLNDGDEWTEETVCWWHMADGAVLGVHDGMIIEYDATTLAPLGMVCSKDELMGRKVAVIDSGLEACDVLDDGAECAETQVAKEQALILYDEDSNDVTVVQPNEDGSYWRKIVRNKMIRMKESRRVKAAKAWLEDKAGEEAGSVLSSWGPYTSTIGQVYKKNDLAQPAVSTKALDSTNKGKIIA